MTMRNPIDVHVGRKLRQLRELHRMSQKELAIGLGISFQQVQKYENAFNRISASRLWQACGILDVKPESFFEGIKTNNSDTQPQDHCPATVALDSRSPIDRAAARQLLELNSFFFRIKDPEVRRKLVVFVKALAIGASPLDTVDQP
jgi:transcriptional regulator with XRE-family HTH domain